MLTVKELKEFLNNYSDDIKIITTSDNYELRGNKVDALVLEGNYIKTTEQFRDDFDGTRYSTEIYKNTKDGEKVIVILGC